MAALPSGAAPFFRTNRRRPSTNCKTGAKRGLLFSLATGKNGYFISRRRQHGSRIWVSPCCPSRDCQAPSFKSVTNADLEPPFHRPLDGGLICPARFSAPNAAGGTRQQSHRERVPAPIETRTAEQHPALQ